MSYRIENRNGGKALVLDGFEQGIATSPYAGIANLKNLNIDDVPGQASVALETTALTKPPTVSAVAYTTDTTADTLSVSDTTGWYNGMAITLNTVVTSTGISTGRVYWVGDLSGTTFKLYKNPSRHASQVVDITGSNGSGTLSSYTLGKPIHRAIAYNPSNISGRFDHYYFILDDNGLAWWVDVTGGTVTNNLIYLGNDTTTGTTGRALAIWKENLIGS